MKRTNPWPVLLLCLPAFVAIWGGWVGLGEKTGFGVINLLPGMVADNSWSTVNTAVTLPIGLETYAAYALHAWMSAQGEELKRFAKWSAVAALLLGGGGQVAFHVMESLGIVSAPWWITAMVATLPVAVLGAGTALASLIRRDNALPAAPAFAPAQPEGWVVSNEALGTRTAIAPDEAHEIDVDAVMERWAAAISARTSILEYIPTAEELAEAERMAAPGAEEDAPTSAQGDLAARVEALIEQGHPFTVDNSAAGASTMRKYAKVARVLWTDAYAEVDYRGERVKREIVENVIRPAMQRERVR